MSAFCQVALPLPLPRLFDYRVPDELVETLQVGCRVEVPFGPRREVGFCVALTDSSEVPASKLKRIRAQIDETPVAGEAIRQLTQWMASYYCCSWGEALAAAVPGSLRKSLAAKTRRVLTLTKPRGEVEHEVRARQDRYPAQARVLRLLLQADAMLGPGELERRCQVSASPVKTLRKAGLIGDTQVPVDDDPLGDAPPAPAPPPALTDDQAVAVEALTAALDSGEFGVSLLHGVTGSGKTEVYLRALEHALAAGGGAIVLIPEISLTPQTVGRFKARVGDVAVLHSGLTPGRRAEQWRALASGAARVAIGPRSAIFAPVADLKLVIVDEEHEGSYKQQSTPRYHARDVAVMRAKQAGAQVVLGSATPALESAWNAQSGKYSLLSLPRRVSSRPMPPVEVIDMTAELTSTGQPKLFSRALVVELTAVLERGEQAILFLNRRGFATFLACPQCQYVYHCESCAVSMTYHRKMDRAVCHHCLQETRPPRTCPVCKSPRFRYGGAGTQKLEAELAFAFPGARYARMDGDTMATAAHYEEVLGRFGRGELDILFGTQMIAKGLDFPNVTFVGVLSADVGLHMPDFRAAERAFGLIAQVAGRAGRGERPGKVLVQSRFGDHYAIQAAADHDYERFRGQEMGLRQRMGYPPFGRLIRVVIEDPDPARAERAGHEARALLQEAIVEGVELLGPAPAPIAILRDRYRYQLQLKGHSSALLAMRPALGVLASKGIGGAHRVLVDVDPTAMM